MSVGRWPPPHCTSGTNPLAADNSDDRPEGEGWVSMRFGRNHRVTPLTFAALAKFDKQQLVQGRLLGGVIRFTLDFI